MSLPREAAHAGSWYSNNGGKLDGELAANMSAARAQHGATLAQAAAVRAVIAPHAGYSYSGPTAAHAYVHLEAVKQSIKRVFVLGPSHHVYLSSCAVSPADVFKTPLGDVPIDTAVVKRLAQARGFTEMPVDVDQDEHSIEMQVPYIAKAMQGCSFTLVPIMVGDMKPADQQSVAQLLAPYLLDPATFFVVSSDFCHWGARFRYQHYERAHGQIFESIEAVDREGMRLIESGSAADFRAYLNKTNNTICGRNPILLLLHTIAASGVAHRPQFIAYAQSSRCTSMSDSSVSYAAAIVTRE